MNNVQLSGRLTKEAELKITAKSKPAATFTLAVDMGLSKAKKVELINEGKATAEFIQITAYGKVAENVANYLEKGSQVIVNGRIHIAKYEKDGQNRYITQVIAQNVEFIGGKKKKEESGTEDDFDSIFTEDEDIFYPVDSGDIPF
jgi:single-strand DNA-binding protein